MRESPTLTLDTRDTSRVWGQGQKAACLLPGHCSCTGHMLSSLTSGAGHLGKDVGDANARGEQVLKTCHSSDFSYVQMLKTANPRAKSQKGIATCSAPEANLPPAADAPLTYSRGPTPARFQPGLASGPIPV